MADKMLEVKELKMYFQTKKGYVKAIDGVNFDVLKGETTGFVGESGCGKTSIGLTLLRILPDNAEIRGGEVLFKGGDLLGDDINEYVDLLKLSDTDARKIKWKGISMVFQAAMNALNPVYKVGDQIVEAIKFHEPDVTKEESRERVAKLFELVGMDPERMENYPHEFSGGMRQRAVIAMALSTHPKMIIMDEPTTALDVIVQDQIMNEIKKIQERLKMTMIYVSHDISVIAEVSKRMAVMYAGRIVEYADAVSVFKHPLHPYTKGLMASFPSIRGELKRLEGIPGEPPNLVDPPTGCRFHPRCPYAREICKKKEPKYREISTNHWVACHAEAGGV
jgi:oligopeptide/dipeptide ABC transporter, ATP-binding protein, C-terminal domain